MGSAAWKSLGAKVPRECPGAQSSPALRAHAADRLPRACFSRPQTWPEPSNSSLMHASSQSTHASTTPCSANAKHALGERGRLASRRRTGAGLGCAAAARNTSTTTAAAYGYRASRTLGTTLGLASSPSPSSSPPAGSAAASRSAVSLSSACRAPPHRTPRLLDTAALPSGSSHPRPSFRRAPHDD